MKKGKNIFELFVDHIRELDYRDRFPFAVRQIGFSKNHYVIVEKLTMDGVYYGKATGVPVKDGNLTRIWIGDPNWRTDLTIPRAENPIWEIVKDVDLTYYRKGSPIPFELHHVLKWGKHEGFSIEEICQFSKSYIVWCITDIDKTFCLSSSALAELKAQGIEFSEDIVSLNNQKIDWYLSDYEDDLQPELYKLQEIEYQRKIAKGEIDDAPF